MRIMNTIFEEMQYLVNPASYNSFRAFLMGTKNQPMFPKGVVYEGVDHESKEFRSECGDNQSIIASLDNLYLILDKMTNKAFKEDIEEIRTHSP